MDVSPTETVDRLRAEVDRLRDEISQLKMQATAPPATHAWLDQVNDAIFVVDAALQIQRWNQAAEQIYGWSGAQAIGRPLWDIIPVVRYLDGASDEIARQAILESGIWRGMFIQHTQAGQAVIIDGSTRALYDDQGAIAGYIAINRDITDRARAEAARDTLEQKLSAILDMLPVGVSILSTERTVSYVNPALEHILGLGHDQLRAGDHRDRTYLRGDGSEMRDTEFASARALHEQRAVYDVETGIIAESGHVIWTSVSAVPVDLPDWSVVTVTTDITDRKRTEAALRASEERFRAIIENGAEGVVLVNGDRQCDYVSSTVTTLLGYTAEIFRTLPVQELTHPDDWPALARLRDTLFAAPAATGRITVRTRHQDGRWRWIERSLINQLHNPAIGAVIVSFRDVTEHKRVEQALRRTADRLTTLRAIEQAILAAHAPVTIANAALARVRDLLGCPHASVILYDQQGAIAQVISSDADLLAALPSGTPQALPPLAHMTSFQRGEPWLDNMVNPQDYDEPMRSLMAAKQVHSFLRIPLLVQWQLIGTLNLAATAPGRFADEDVTIAQEIGNTLAIALHNAQLIESLQQELAARERAEAALLAEHARVIQLKNEFMATMSHELRTPLAAVLGRAELLLDGIYGPLNERQSTATRTIEQSGRNLLALINDILDYAKFEAGHIALDPVPTAVANICAESMRAVAQSALIKQIELRTTLDQAVTVIAADARRLQQILVNLLSNAVKFTPEGGEVDLIVRGDAARQIVNFTVKDTGIGIASEDRARLFQPFTQLDSKLSRQYEGTGLGLALVRRLVEAHSGSVVVESAPGQGSRFHVTLPWVPEPSASLAEAESAILDVVPESNALPAALQPAPPSDKLPLIVLVEDRASNVEVIWDMLTTRGYELIVARDGLAGLTCVYTHRPALVLMDIQLPDMSGLEVIQAIRADVTLRDIPIIALTALVMAGDRERCLDAGADEYLAKPVSLHTLLDVIGRLLARR